MGNIKLVFEFENICAAKDFMSNAEDWIANVPSCKPSKPGVLHDSQPVVIPAATPVVPATPVVIPAAAPVVPAQAPAQTKPTAPAATGGRATQAMLRKALKDYKERNGHPAYKELLGYFGVTSVRDIPKNDWAAAVEMANGSEPVAASPEVITSATVPALPAEQVTPEQLRQGLVEHKARWGMEATKAVLVSLGYADPNTIPVERYQDVLTALINDDPSEETMDSTISGVDLSQF